MRVFFSLNTFQGHHASSFFTTRLQSVWMHPLPHIRSWFINVALAVFIENEIVLLVKSLTLMVLDRSSFDYASFDCIVFSIDTLFAHFHLSLLAHRYESVRASNAQLIIHFLSNEPTFFPVQLSCLILEVHILDLRRFFTIIVNCRDIIVECSLGVSQII